MIIETMNVRHDPYTLRRRSSQRLRRAVVASVFVHAGLVGAAVALGAYWKSAPPELGFQMEFLARGQLDAPEGIESTHIEGSPPGPPEAKPEPPAVAAKVEEPKPKPEPEKPKEPPKPEPKKEPEKKPEVKKEPEKKEPPKKEEKKEEAKKPEKKKPDTIAPLSDDMLNNLIAKDMESAAKNPATAAGGGMEGTRASTRAQTGMGDPNSTDTGISVKGIPSVLGTWANQVRRRVQRFWNQPAGVGINNKVAVSFWVNRDGQLLGEPEIIEPSNDAGLDESGLRAVRLAAPFPPLPPQFDQPKQQVIFIFTLSG